MKYLVFIGLCACVSVNVNLHAETCEASNQLKTAFYFSTGINNTPAQTRAGTQELETVYKNQLESSFPDTEVSFFPANNPTQGLITDAIQVLEQKMIEQGVDTTGVSSYQLLLLLQEYKRPELLDALALLTRTAADDLALLFSDVVVENLQNGLANALSNATNDLTDTSSLHTSTYEADLLAGKRVLILSHSQGNLFTNDAVATVSQRQPNFAQSIGFYGVATPATSHYNNADYVTADDDRIINALRLLENILPANIDNDPGIRGDNRDFINHGFFDSYFDQSLASRSRIDAGITNLFDTLSYPPSLAREGALRATLTWGSQPDMDLHVYEPDGAHVYYRNLTGNAGTLDVDDTSSFGPENYVVDCSTIVEGQYNIGVNYYSGSAPETATINVFVSDGQSITPRDVTLNSSVGSSGNDSPTILYTVTVSRDTEGGLIYQVQ